MRTRLAVGALGAGDGLEGHRPVGGRGECRGCLTLFVNVQHPEKPLADGTWKVTKD